MLLIGESVARIAIAEIQILVGHNSDNSLADGDLDDPAMFDTIQRHAFELTVIGFAFPRQRRNRLDQHRHQIHVAAALVAQRADVQRRGVGAVAKERKEQGRGRPIAVAKRIEHVAERLVGLDALRIPQAQTAERIGRAAQIIRFA